jgi:Uri superfamily endonuclease
VQRHQELAAGERDARHWHVDYLLGQRETTVDSVFVTDEADVECETARALTDAATPIGGLGASDCDCETHLAYADSRELLAAAASDAHVREFP